MANFSGTDTTTTSAVFIDEKWDEWVIRFREKKLKSAEFFRRLDATVSESGDIIHLPQVTEETAVTFTENENLFDKLTTTTETDIQLTVDQYIVRPFLIQDRLARQSKYDKKAIRYKSAAYAVAKYLDAAVLADSDNYTTTDVNTDGSSLTNTDLTQAQLALDTNDVPEEDRMWFFHPQVMKDLLDLTGNYFVSYDFTQTQGIVKGKIHGELLGSPVCKTTNIQTGSAGSPAATMYKNVYAHKEATALAMQWTPDIQEQYKIEAQGTLCNVRTLYGIKTTRADHGVQVLRTTS